MDPANRNPNLCYIGVPNKIVQEQMKQTCVNKWMKKMADGNGCISYFSNVASDNCSAAEIKAACELASRHFTVDDATRLCDGLQEAHQEFWMSRFTHVNNQ